MHRMRVGQREEHYKKKTHLSDVESPNADLHGQERSDCRQSLNDADSHSWFYILTKLDLSISVVDEAIIFEALPTGNYIQN